MTMVWTSAFPAWAVFPDLLWWISLSHSQPSLFLGKLISLLSPRGQHCYSIVLACDWLLGGHVFQTGPTKPRAGVWTQISAPEPEYMDGRGVQPKNHCTRPPLNPLDSGFGAEIWGMNSRVQLGGKEGELMQWGYRFSHREPYRSW